MIKAVFLDFDYTLYSHNAKGIPQSAVEAIAKARENGIMIFLATGRNIYELRDFPQCLKIPFDGYVLMNGQLCLDANFNDVFNHPITGKALDALVEMFQSKQRLLVFVEKDFDYINYYDEKIYNINEELGLHRDVCEYRGNPLYLAVAYVTREQEPELLAKLPGCCVKRWSDWGVDIVSEGIDKANSIEYYMDKLGIQADECMAVGDSLNDINMLKYAGISVAMGNGYDEVKKTATFVTTDIDKDGIYNAFKHFGLITD